MAFALRKIFLYTKEEQESSIVVLGPQLIPVAMENGRDGWARTHKKNIPEMQFK